MEETGDECNNYLLQTYITSFFFFSFSYYKIHLNENPDHLRPERAGENKDH